MGRATSLGCFFYMTWHSRLDPSDVSFGSNMCTDNEQSLINLKRKQELVCACVGKGESVSLMLYFKADCNFRSTSSTTKNSGMSFKHSFQKNNNILINN